MWKIVQELLPIALVIIFLTQVLIPVILNKTTWWLFRPEKKKKEVTNPLSLPDEINQTKTIVDEAKAKVDEVIEKVEGNLKSAEDLKKEAEKLK